jgi:hypothetical protein
MLWLLYVALLSALVAAFFRWRSVQYQREHAILPRKRKSSGPRVRLLE